MSDQRQKLGDLGEEIASNYLKKKGYKILERQYKSQYGEIDIIAEHKKTLVFVEVKARRSDDFGLPEEAVDERKLEKIIATGNCYNFFYLSLINSLFWKSKIIRSPSFDL